MNTSMKNADGSPTAYALACGDTQTATTRTGAAVTLWMEHGTYHVRTHDHNGRGRLAWDVFDNLTEARRAFRRHKRTL